jgi:hypothetical protein
MVFADGVKSRGRLKITRDLAMTESTCPHCHAAIPDAEAETCPQCGRLLGFPALNVDSPTISEVQRRKHRANAIQTLAIIGVMCSLVLAAFAVGRNDGAATIEFLVMAVVLIASSLFALRKPRSTTRPKGYRAKMIILVTIGAVLYFAFRDMTFVNQAAIQGIIAPGEYRNEFLNLRFRYGAEWREMTAKARESVKASGRFSNQELLFYLARVTHGAESAADISLLATPLSYSEQGLSSTDGLNSVLQELRKEPINLRDVKMETASHFAGLEFARMSLRFSPPNRGEVGMTFWITVTRRCLVMIMAKHADARGLRAVEELLSKKLESLNSTTESLVTEVRTAPSEDLAASQDESLTSDEYIRLGMPAHDREWSVAEMTDAAQVLTLLVQKGYVKLPRYKSERSGEVFARLVSPQKLALFTN